MHEGRLSSVKKLCDSSPLMVRVLIALRPAMGGGRPQPKDQLPRIAMPRLKDVHGSAIVRPSRTAFVMTSWNRSRGFYSESCLKNNSAALLRKLIYLHFHFHFHSRIHAEALGRFYKSPLRP